MEMKRRLFYGRDLNVMEILTFLKKTDSAAIEKEPKRKPEAAVYLKSPGYWSGNIH